MSKSYGYDYSGTFSHIVDVASSLPKDPNKLLSKGWIDITHPDAKKANHLLLQEVSTGLKIGFDKGIPGASGFKGKDHYHILNPDATGNHNLYLDKNANPTKKGAKNSHVLPEGDD